MKRRSVWQWIAEKAHIQERVDYETKMAWFRMGLARATGKPVHLAWQEYPFYLDRQEGVAIAQVLDKPPTVASYEPPDKQTGPTRPVNPEQLRKLIGTTTLPAIPGELVRKFREQQRKTGKLEEEDRHHEM